MTYGTGGWVEGAKSLWCLNFADRQTNRTGGAGCIKVGTKACKTQQAAKLVKAPLNTCKLTDRQTDIQTDRYVGCEWVVSIVP